MRSALALACLFLAACGAEPADRFPGGARAGASPGTSPPTTGAGAGSADERPVAPAASGTAVCECGIAKRVFALYNADRVGRGLAPVAWDEGTARLTTEAARQMAFELEFEHSTDQIKGKCRQVSGNGSRGTFCYVNEERITRVKCRAFPCSVEDIARSLYASVARYTTRYSVDYKYYSVGVFLEKDTFWLTEWMNEGPSLPNGGQCLRSHCPGQEADEVEVAYDPGATASFCPHWVNPIWDANQVEFPSCNARRFEEVIGAAACGPGSPALTLP